MNKQNQVEIFDKVRRACRDARYNFNVNKIAVETGLRHSVVKNKFEILRLFKIIERENSKYNYIGLPGDFLEGYVKYKNIVDKMKNIQKELKGA